MSTDDTETTEIGALRRAVVISGHAGDDGVARQAWSHADPSVRVVALGALERVGALDDALLAEAFRDPAVSVRMRAAELAAAHPATDLLPLLHDTDPTVLDVAAWACGEHEDGRDAIVERLLVLARSADDAIVRESAVAALGAIGDERAVDTIIAAATGDKPAVRRRAVLALAPFDGPDVDRAIDAALNDRDWQVRQSAEDLGPSHAAPADPPSDPRAT